MVFGTADAAKWVKRREYCLTQPRATISTSRTPGPCGRPANGSRAAPGPSPGNKKLRVGHSGLHLSSFVYNVPQIDIRPNRLKCAAAQDPPTCCPGRRMRLLRGRVASDDPFSRDVACRLQPCSRSFSFPSSRTRLGATTKPYVPSLLIASALTARATSKNELQ